MSALIKVMSLPKGLFRVRQKNTLKNIDVKNVIVMFLLIGFVMFFQTKVGPKRNVVLGFKEIGDTLPLRIDSLLYTQIQTSLAPELLMKSSNA